MKKRWNLLFIAIATVLLLTACGTSDSGKDSTNGKPEGTVDKNATEEGIEDSEEQSTDAEDTNPEGNNTTTSNQIKDAQLTDSDAQDYSIYLLPSYKLTSEEPGRDILYVEENDSIFMRIETIEAEEGAYEFAVENIVEVLKASSEGSTPEEFTDADLLPTGPGIENAKGFSVNSETGPVTGLVFNQNGIVVKITIFDSPKAEHYEKFLQMAETIVKK